MLQLEPIGRLHFHAELLGLWKIVADHNRKLDQVANSENLWRFMLKKKRLEGLDFAVCDTDLASLVRRQHSHLPGCDVIRKFESQPRETGSIGDYSRRPEQGFGKVVTQPRCKCLFVNLNLSSFSGLANRQG